MASKEWNKSFGNNLKRILNEKGITQSNLAALIVSTETTVSRWVNGERIPSAYAIVRIANALKVDLDELLYIAPPEMDLNEAIFELKALREFCEEYANSDEASMRIWQKSADACGIALKIMQEKKGTTDNE